MPRFRAEYALLQFVDEVSQVLSQRASQIGIGGADGHLHLARMLRDFQLDTLIGSNGKS